MVDDRLEAYSTPESQQRRKSWYLDKSENLLKKPKSAIVALLGFFNKNSYSLYGI